MKCILLNYSNKKQLKGDDMAIPESIRKVPRPVNTVVQDTGREGSKRYIVRERKSIKYISNQNPQPVNGKTIGYIIEGRFVPIQDKTALSGPSEFSYGSSALIRDLSADIKDDLLAVYPVNDVYSILALAALKVMRPRISSTRLASAYHSSYICKVFPGAALSKNSVSDLYQRLGKDGPKRSKFYNLRLEHVTEEHHIAIDGTLKQNTSRVNDLGDFSYKARLKGCEDISILYAYDLELMEPVCSMVFPGNSIDAVSYKEFIRSNNIDKGIIVADKGFPPNSIRTELKDRPELHYLTPIKRNDRRIEKLNLLEFDNVVPGIDKLVQYSWKETGDGLYLYAFRDAVKASAEERTYLEAAKKKGTYKSDDYQRKKPRFGLIVYESDLSMDARTAYLCYEDRWKLEMVFKAYKSDECLDRTLVHGDYSIHGSEFVNFISTLITCRIIAKATKAGVFEELTYKDMMEDLNSAWRKFPVPEDVIPTTNDAYWVHTINQTFELLEKLGISQPIPKQEPAKRGRKSGKQKAVEEQGDLPKRPVGRPRKNPPKDPNAIKRTVGRPRKHPPKDPNAPKNPVGRPRKNPPPDPNMPKRLVGRPRKIELEI